MTIIYEVDLLPRFSEEVNRNRVIMGCWCRVFCSSTRDRKVFFVLLSTDTDNKIILYNNTIILFIKAS